MTLQPGSRPVPNSPDYVLVRKLGAGAFGEVWHAHGPGGLDVALKFISNVPATELRSLKVMKGIRHPNLVSLFGAWYKDGLLILAMELCDRSLYERLVEAQSQNLPGIPLTELLSYMSDAASGLDSLNTKQVQHRDVKPANLLLLDSGVKVADYGLAKVLEQTVASNSGPGTVAYTAPECFRGTITQQSDQYSLAVTYYHLRTGRMLFKGNQAQIMYGHLEGEPDLSRLPPLERAILSRALAKEPSERWPKCTEFVDELIAAAKRAASCKEAVSRALYSRDPDEAIRLCDEGVRLCPDHAFAYLVRGVAWFRKRMYGADKEACDNAIKNFDQAIYLNPNDSSAYKQRGDIWFAKGDYDQAIRDFDEAIRLSATTQGDDLHDEDEEVIRASTDELYSCRGDAWSAKGEYDKAIKDYDEAIRRDPDCEYYYSRGLAWDAKREYDRAINDFDHGIRRRRHRFARLRELNAPEIILQNELEMLARLEDARKDAERKKLADEFVNCGNAWLKQKDYCKAICEFTKAIQHDPDRASAYTRRGDAFASSGCQWIDNGEYDKGIRAYLEAFGDYDDSVRLDANSPAKEKGKRLEELLKLQLKKVEALRVAFDLAWRGPER